MKKAIMVDFLTTVLLAIIIFVPTCYMLSKVFVLSDQAKNSFGTMVGDIQKFAEDENALSSNSIIVLDKGTALLLYADKTTPLAYDVRETNFNLPTEGDQNAKREEYVLPFPAGKCQDIPCACLCRKFGDTLNTEESITRVDLSPTDIRPTAGFLTLYSHTYTMDCTLLLCESLSKVPLKE